MRKEYANEILAQSRAGYEKISVDFSQTRGKFWKELLFVRDMIPKGARLLDIGCGNGRFLGASLDDSINYTGLDFSKGLIAVARERYGSRADTAFVVGDALALPFPDHSFDIVVSFAVLHHIPSRAYRVQFLREAVRVVKPGEQIILTAWNVSHAKPRIILKYAFKKICGLARLGFVFKNLGGLSRLDFGDAFLSFGKEKDARFVHAFSKRELLSLAHEANLIVEELGTIRRPSGEENFFMILRA